MEAVSLLTIPEAVAQTQERHEVEAKYSDFWYAYANATIKVVRQGSRILIPDDQLAIVAQALKQRALRRRASRRSA